VLFVDPAEMPAADDVARLGQAVGANQWLYELMVNFAAYTGLRWGELIALTAGLISRAERVVTVDGKVVEVRGHLFVEAPKNASGVARSIRVPPRRAGRWPRWLPRGSPRMTAEQASGRNPRLGGDGGVRSPGRRAVRTWES
jgi:integrase